MLTMWIIEILVGDSWYFQGSRLSEEEALSLRDSVSREGQYGPNMVRTREVSY